MKQIHNKGVCVCAFHLYCACAKVTWYFSCFIMSFVVHHSPITFIYFSFFSFFSQSKHAYFTHITSFQNPDTHFHNVFSQFEGWSYGVYCLDCQRITPTSVNNNWEGFVHIGKTKHGKYLFWWVHTVFIWNYVFLEVFDVNWMYWTFILISNNSLTPSPLPNYLNGMICGGKNICLQRGFGGLTNWLIG